MYKIIALLLIISMNPLIAMDLEKQNPLDPLTKVASVLAPIDPAPVIDATSLDEDCGKDGVMRPFWRRTQNMSQEEKDEIFRKYATTSLYKRFSPFRIPFQVADGIVPNLYPFDEYCFIKR